MVSLVEKPYANRREAGRRLAESLTSYRTHHPVVLGIPRGGVVVADTIARALDADLDIVLTRKLGAPGNPELAIGAVSENGRVIVQREIAATVGADEDYIEREKQRQLAEILARRERYRNVRPKVPLQGRTTILVDDGIATGATMQASIWAAREEGPQEIVVAVPVGPLDAIERLKHEADHVVCPYVPRYFYAIGQFYLDFEQVDDRAVMEILAKYNPELGERNLETPADSRP